MHKKVALSFSEMAQPFVCLATLVFTDSDEYMPLWAIPALLFYGPIASWLFYGLGMILYYLLHIPLCFMPMLIKRYISRRIMAGIVEDFSPTYQAPYLSPA